MYELTVDLATLTAAAVPVAERVTASQPPQAQQYDLDVVNFLTRDGFRIEGVVVLPSGAVEVQFSHAHPFPAPNLALPISGLNRADLGYTGRCLVLATGNPRSFLDGTYRVSPDTILNADGYLAPGDLLAGLSLTAVNLFPYVLLADEAKDNRIGRSNLGVMTGSYQPAAGGWQRSNLGPEGTGWTGYDFVHGGQSVRNSIVISPSAMASGFFRADVAILIKYTDPRGQGGPSRRLPPDPASVLDFAYRLPYAALDMSVIRPEVSPLLVGAGAGDSVGARFFVRDWDAVATEAADAILGSKTNVSLIQPGAAGKGRLTLVAPDLSDEFPQSSGSAGSPSGHPGDELVYRPTLTNKFGTARGRVFALAILADPELNDIDRDTYAFGVDPVTLVPDPARAVRPITCQILPVDVGGSSPTGAPVITSVTPENGSGASSSTLTFRAEATGAPFLYAWTFGGGTNPPTAYGQEVEVALTDAGSYQGQVVAVNAAGTSAPYAFNYSVNDVPLVFGITATPSIITPGISVQFEASTTSPPDTWLWTFPPGFSPPTSTAPTPTVTAASTPGQYLLRLTVGNAAGDSPEFEFPLTVERPASPDWLKYTLRPTYSTPYAPAIALGVANFPLIVYVENTGSLSTLYGAQALTFFPEVGSDWTEYVIASSTSERIRSSRVAMLDSKPVVVYATDSQLRFARSTVADPQTSTDWSRHQVLTHIGQLEVLELETIGDRAHWLVWDRTNPGDDAFPRYGRSTTATPGSSGDWLQYPFVVLSDQVFRPTMCNNNGKPAMAFADPSAPGIRLALADTATPASQVNWTFSVATTDFLSALSLRPSQAALVLVGTQPADNYRPYVYRSANATPTGPGSWTSHRASASYGGVEQLYVNTWGTRINFAAQDKFAGDLIYSKAVDPDEEADWAHFWVVTMGPSQGELMAVAQDSAIEYVVAVDAFTGALNFYHEIP
ncbi:MAG: hypothetical protein GEEBNDBF_00693 [bacterium]|nr:hypothetical protein [bacterium]